jgi:hypothetical protein
MKTIVGRGADAGVVAVEAGFGAGCEHPQTPTANSDDNATIKRRRKVFSEVSEFALAKIAAERESKSIHERRMTTIYGTRTVR